MGASSDKLVNDENNNENPENQIKLLDFEEIKKIPNDQYNYLHRMLINSGNFKY